MIPENVKELNCKKNTKYSLYTCGASNKIPYCDNAHRDINSKLGTNYKSLKIWAKRDTILKILSSTWNKE